VGNREKENCSEKPDQPRSTPSIGVLYAIEKVIVIVGVLLIGGNNFVEDSINLGKKARGKLKARGCRGMIDYSPTENI
jgi:hypothetical protein